MTSHYLFINFLYTFYVAEQFFVKTLLNFYSQYYFKKTSFLVYLFFYIRIALNLIMWITSVILYYYNNLSSPKHTFMYQQLHVLTKQPMRKNNTFIKHFSYTSNFIYTEIILNVTELKLLILKEMNQYRYKEYIQTGSVQCSLA